MTDFRQFSDGRLTEAVADDKRVALADFELSVERHLDSWVDSFRRDDSAPDVIASCIKQYFASAKAIYEAGPEENSIMILTILDLWKALDVLTITQYPLLESYSPEIPQDFLHPLLLHRSGSLRRAELIEKHISQRHEEASCTASVFSDDPTESSFARRYYRDSPRLQQLHTEIDQHAQREQEEKRSELSVLNEKWKSLKGAASKMVHTCASKGSLGPGVFRQHCDKCKTNDEADKLKIEVFEWPLPQETAQAQLLVFELSPPPGFSAWREITYMILCDVGQLKPKDSEVTSISASAIASEIASKIVSTISFGIFFKSASKIVEKTPLLEDVPGLRRWAKRHTYHRITMLSITRPDSYAYSYSSEFNLKSVNIPADAKNILFNNGLLSMQLIDRASRTPAAGPFASTIVSTFAPVPPSSTPYSKIHSFVTGTHHSPNQVIAAQIHCPPELNLHEYMAFAGLRSGPCLQWLNVAREIPSPSLSFRHEEVHTLITQAAWQIGPLSDNAGVREWHIDLGHSSFGKTLLQELEALLRKIKANWQEEVTVRTIGT